MVDKAMDVSQDGNMFSRTVRNLTGKSLNAEMKPTVRYSDKAIVRMLDKIRGAIDRKPIDATVKIDSSGIERHESRTGLAVRSTLLHRNIRKALVSTTADLGPPGSDGVSYIDSIRSNTAALVDGFTGGKVGC